MNKKILETFVKKYSLGNNIESVKWVISSKDKTLSTNTINDEKNVLVGVKFNKFEDIKEDVEFGVYETSIFTKMLGVLNEEIVVSVEKEDGEINALILSDNKTEARFIVADSSVIPAAPPLKKLPEFNVEIKLTPEFVGSFVKSKNALPDVNSFTLLMNKKKKLELVLGYSKINSNRITIGIETVKDKDVVKKNITFNANYLKEILSANTDCVDAMLKISDEGLAFIQFTNDSFVSTYYMLELKNVD